MVFGPDGKLASGGEDRIIRLWNVDMGVVLRELQGSIGEIYGLAFHPKGNILASGEFAGLEASKIHLWNSETGEEVSAVPHKGGSVWNVAFTNDGHYLASGGGDSTVRIWDTSDLSNPRLIAQQVTADGNEVYGLAFDKTGTQLASAGMRQHIQLYSVPTLAKIKTFPNRHRGGIYSLALNADGTQLVTASLDHTVLLWDVLTDQTTMLRGHERPVWTVTFHPTKNIVASGGLDHRIQVWNLNEIEQLRTLSAHALFTEAQDDTCLSIIGEQLLFQQCKAPWSRTPACNK
jgi:FOG: WD40 repeat